MCHRHDGHGHNRRRRRLVGPHTQDRDEDTTDDEWSPGILASVRLRILRHAVEAVSAYALRRARKRAANLRAAAGPV